MNFIGALVFAALINAEADTVLIRNASIRDSEKGRVIPYQARSIRAVSSRGLRVHFGTHSVPQETRFPDVMAGRWTTRAIHHERAGTQFEERGVIDCRWILERTYLQCDRTHTNAQGGIRRSMQLYLRDATGRVEILYLYAGRGTRILQQSIEASDTSLVVTAVIPLSDGRMAANRGRLSALPDGRLQYRSETEEQAGHWRLDFVETYTKVQ